MAKIYVSSTYGDLREHREAVYRVLRDLGHDVVAMEDYVASDQRPVDRCLADVAASDVYVGILAWRYGYVPPENNPDGRSITELEYRHAKHLGIPCLLFMLAEDARWPVRWVDAVSADSGKRISALRAELARDHVVIFFDTSQQLARSVATAVTNQLTASPAQPPVADQDRGASLLMLYADPDERLVQQLMARLASLERRGLVATRAEFRIHQEIGFYSSGWLRILESEIVLLILSSELVGTGYLASEQFEALANRHWERRLRIIPVLLRPVSLSALPGVLNQIPFLPSRTGAVTESPSREAALVEVVDGVLVACQELVARRHAQGQARPARPARPARVHHRLVEVFKESGVPSVTFVEPDDFYQLKLALEQPGRGAVIEGPSGVGKTTALQTAIRQLPASARTGFEVLRARDRAHVTRIAELPSWHRGPVAIDDFHRLPAALRANLVDYLKLLADTEPADRKLVIVGIPGTKQNLAKLAFDVATRIDVLTLGTVGDDKVLEMIGKGEAALNVELVGKSEVVRTAAGSLNVAQVLCRHIMALAGIRETQATTTPVESDLPRATRKAMEKMALKFEGLVRSFAALDGRADRFCIELLMELAASKDGTLPLWHLRDRRPDLAQGVDRFVSKRLMDTLAERHPDHDQHILYDPDAATLVIDDPQLVFYLRQVTAEQLAVDVGKLPMARRARVFVSYSHKDASWLQQLQVHLKPLERTGLIDLWDDTKIKAGSDWRDELGVALDSARVAILLVSADFLASDYINDNELPPLLDAAERDGCTVLPLLLRPSLFGETPELRRFQAANANAIPLSAMSTDDQETVMVGLAKRIAELVRR